MFRFLNGVAQEKPPIKPSIASVIPFATHIWSSMQSNLSCRVQLLHFMFLINWMSSKIVLIFKNGKISCWPILKEISNWDERSFPRLRSRGYS